MALRTGVTEAAARAKFPELQAAPGTRESGVSGSAGRLWCRVEEFGLAYGLEGATEGFRWKGHGL